MINTKNKVKSATKARRVIRPLQSMKLMYGYTKR